MHVYVFVTTSDPTVRAFSHDAKGDNLPAEYAPWRRDSGDDVIAIDLPADPMAKDIRRKGYYLVQLW